MRIVAEGNTGHGSRFIEGAAVEQILGVTQKALAFRQQQKGMYVILYISTNCVHPLTDSNATVKLTFSTRFEPLDLLYGNSHTSNHQGCSHGVVAKKTTVLG